MFSISDEEIDKIISENTSYSFEHGDISPLAIDELGAVPKQTADATHKQADALPEQAVGTLPRQSVDSVSKQALDKPKQAASDINDSDSRDSSEDDVSEVEHIEHAKSASKKEKSRGRRKALSRSQARPPNIMGLPRVEPPPPPPNSRTRVADMERARAFYKPRVGKSEVGDGNETETGQEKEGPPRYETLDKHKEFFDKMDEKRHRLSQGWWENTFSGGPTRPGPPDRGVTVFRPTEPEGQTLLHEKPTIQTQKGWASIGQLARKEELKRALRGEDPAEEPKKSTGKATGELDTLATSIRSELDKAEKLNASLGSRLKTGLDLTRALSRDIDEALAGASARIKYLDDRSIPRSMASNLGSASPLRRRSQQEALHGPPPRSLPESRSLTSLPPPPAMASPPPAMASPPPSMASPPPRRETQAPVRPRPKIKRMPPVAPLPRPLFWGRPTQWTGLLSSNYPPPPKPEPEHDYAYGRTMTPRPVANVTTTITPSPDLPPDITPVLDQPVARGHRGIPLYILLNLREGLFLLPRDKVLVQHKGELYFETYTGRDIDEQLDEDGSKPFVWDSEGVRGGKVPLSAREVEFAMEEFLPGDGWGLVFSHKRRAWYMTRPGGSAAAVAELDLESTG